MRELLAVPVKSIAKGNVIEMPVFGKDFPLKVVAIEHGTVITRIEAQATFGTSFLFTVPTISRVRRPIYRSNVLRLA